MGCVQRSEQELQPEKAAGTAIAATPPSPQLGLKFYLYQLAGAAAARPTVKASFSYAFTHIYIYDEKPEQQLVRPRREPLVPSPAPLYFFFYYYCCSRARLPCSYARSLTRSVSLIHSQSELTRNRRAHIFPSSTLCSFLAFTLPYTFSPFTSLSLSFSSSSLSLPVFYFPLSSSSSSISPQQSSCSSSSSPSSSALVEKYLPVHLCPRFYTNFPHLYTEKEQDRSTTRRESEGIHSRLGSCVTQSEVFQ